MAASGASVVASCLVLNCIFRGMLRRRGEWLLRRLVLCRYVTFRMLTDLVFVVRAQRRVVFSGLPGVISELSRCDNCRHGGCAGVTYLPSGVIDINPTVAAGGH